MYAKNAKSNLSYVFIIYTVFSIVFLVSPILHSISITASKILVLSLFIILYMMYYRNRLISLKILFFISLIFITSLLSGLYSQSIIVGLYSSLFTISLLLLSLSNLDELYKVVHFATKLLFFILIGAIIAYLLNTLGKEPLMQYTTSGGRILDVYLFSLGEDAMVGAGQSYKQIIRTSGIYDEPGAFSMVICLVAAMRHLLGMNNKKTWILLLLGFITFSLAHLIYVIIHWFSDTSIKNKIGKLIKVMFLSFIITISLGIIDDIVKGIFNRFIIITDNGIVLKTSNNRTKHFKHAINSLDNITIKDIFFGMDSTCLTGGACMKGRLDFTPLSPMLIQGLLLSWHYYIILFILIILGLRKQHYLVLIGVALLFMQRASMHSIGYSMLIALILTIIIKQEKFKDSFHFIREKYK